MNDLISMLLEQKLGLNLASDIINCLLFVDDICLNGQIGAGIANSSKYYS